MVEEGDGYGYARSKTKLTPDALSTEIAGLTITCSSVLEAGAT